SSSSSSRLTCSGLMFSSASSLSASFSVTSLYSITSYRPPLPLRPCLSSLVSTSATQIKFCLISSPIFPICSINSFVTSSPSHSSISHAGLPKRNVQALTVMNFNGRLQYNDQCSCLVPTTKPVQVSVQRL